MKRVLAMAAFVTAAVALAVPANAGMSTVSYENDYEGHAERDPFTYVGFDVIKRRGSKKIAHVTADLRYRCRNGQGGGAAARARGRLAVEDGRFKGTLKRRFADSPVRAGFARGGAGGPVTYKYRIKGKLLKQGKARGEIDAELTFTPGKMSRGTGAETRCYTGGLDWKAERGAEADPED